MYRSSKFVIASALLAALCACSQGDKSVDGVKNASDKMHASASKIISGNGPSFSDVEMISPEKQTVGHYGLGSAASAEEIAGWDIDIRPDGMGLPDGSGTVEDGEMLYEEQCASCHGSFGEGAQGYPVLAGGEGSLTEERPEKTVGSYWPYASTLWDYIHRAMPFQAPESLEDDEVYALTAYVLYLNDLVEDDFELTRDTFSEIEMPNKDSFYRDDRPDVQAERCMQDCKSGEIEITSEPMNATYFVGELAKTAASSEEAGSAMPVDNEITSQASNEASNEAKPVNALGEETYTAACAMCHASGLAGAPVTGDAEQWTERLAKGEQVLIESAINGLGAMPAKGGRSDLSDEAVTESVAYMLSKLQ